MMIDFDEFMKNYIDEQKKQGPKFERELQRSKERMDLALEIREARLSRGISKKELAKRIHRSVRYVNLIEDTSIQPSPKMMDKIADALDYRVETKLIKA